MDDHYFEFFGQIGPVYSVPLPGHFPSVYDESDDPLTFDRLIELTILTIKKLIGEQQEYLLVGHSSGSLVSMEIALRDPSNVKGMILQGGAASGLEHGGAIELMQTFALKKFGGLTKLMLKLSTMNRLFHHIGMAEIFSSKDYRSKYDFDALESQYLPAMQSLDGDVVVLYLKLLAEVDITDALTGIDCPCLFLTGKDDPYISVEDNLKLSNVVQKGSLCVVDDCGHWPMYEQPETFQSAVQSWWRDACVSVE